MRTIIAGLIAIGLGLAQAPAGSRAMVAKGRTRRAALVIGNASYGTAPLRNPVNDAEAVAGTLRDLGFTVSLVKNVGLAQMEAAVDQFSGGLRNGDFALFYYSGHGVQYQGENYLLPVDFQLTSGADIKYKSYSASRVRDKLEESGAGVRILVLDACRNNPFSTSRGVSGGLNQMKSDAAGTLIAFGTADGQTADDNPAERNGLFTKYLLVKMRQRDLDVRAIFRRARDEVYAASGRRQLPFVYDGLTGDDAYLHEGGPVMARVTTGPDLAAMAYERIRGSNNRGAIEAFLREFGDSDYAKLARIELASLRGPEPVINRQPVESGIEQRGLTLRAAGRYVEEAALYRKAAEAGDAEGMRLLGTMYFNGMGVTRDEAEAVRWYQKSAATGNPSGQAMLGRSYAFGRAGLTRDGNEALRLCKGPAESGNPQGMNCMGLLYSMGAGVTKDSAESFRWYKKSAEGGNQSSMVSLAFLYLRGNGVATDEAEALRWYRRAAEGGYPNAMGGLARMLEQGKGTPKNDAEAFRWFKKAAEAGSLLAMRDTAQRYADGTGTARDDAAANQWYRKAVDLGDTPSMVALGKRYVAGTGVTADLAEASRLYKQAAERGNREGMSQWGLSLVFGRGVTRDDAAGVGWFRKAAEAGDRDGMNYLGVSYGTGRGVEKSDVEAANWYRKAAELGSPVANSNLGNMYRDGRGVAKDLAEAERFYQKAIDLGFEPAKKRLADLKAGVTKK